MDPMMQQMGMLGMYPPQSAQGPMQAGPGVPMGGTPPVAGPMNGGDPGPLLALLMQLMGGGGVGDPAMGMGPMGGPPMGAGPPPVMMPGMPPGGMQPPAGGPPMMM